MIKQNTRIKYRILQVLFIAVAGLVIWSCNDELGIDPYRLDIRLEGKDKIVIIPVNPNTKTEYTAEEIINLDYNPYVEEYYIDSQEVVVNVWIQDKPLKAEIFVDKQDIPFITLTEWTESNRPDLTMENNGNGYLATWKTSLEDLGIGLFESQIFNIKVTYNDVGQDDWEQPSVKETSYTVYHTEPPVIPNLGENLVGYWDFNSSNLLGATIGRDLTLGGAATHSAVDGVSAEDGASYVDIGTWYNVAHAIPPVKGDRVNTYTMIWDVKVAAADLGKYICLFQFNTDNDSDGSLYINPAGGFWFNGGPSSFDGTIQADTWHRLSLSVDAPNLILYVDGVEVYASDIAGEDGKFSLDPSKFLILGENSSNDGNGEDNPISISDFYLLDIALTRENLKDLPDAGIPAFDDHAASSLKGRWSFNTDNLLSASVGNDLTLGGAETHSAETGSYEGDGAAHVGIGTWYNVENHGIAASGEDGERVNEYTMIWDVKVAAADIGKYICLLQFNTANDSDGSLYINPAGGFWFNGGPSDFSGTIQADTWHRLVLSVSAPDLLFYVDGVEIYKADIAGVDGKFSLDQTKFLILGENSSNHGNGEDNPISISEFIVFDKAMTVEQLKNMPSVTKPVL